MKNKTFNKAWFKLGIVVLVVFLIMMTGNVDVAAQSTPGPPVFPSNPSEAPIDGGLGLLAAAGGAYAWKKLKSKNKEGL